MSQVDPFRLTAAEIQRLIVPDTPAVPELEAARLDRAALRRAPQTQIILAQTEDALNGLEQMPSTPYTQYRQFIRTGDRRSFQEPYFLKRRRIAALALRMFLGQIELKDALQDYLWSVCEETNWVVPAHERWVIDLFSAETAFMLADLVNLVGEQLDPEVRTRVRGEVERRVFEPYLRFASLNKWYHGRNNWNGVCNSSVACAFFLLEPDLGRVARALEMALASLKTYFAVAFEPDGCSTEGSGYWHYGLSNLVALGEILRARTNGALDLFDSERLRQIAAYPARMMLSAPRFATFSDSDPTPHFNPGMVVRLAERTGERSLYDLITPRLPGEPNWRLTMMLRSVLWWDGAYHTAAPVADAYFPIGGIARLTARAANGAHVVVAIKAGHNDENHNHNDVGSFIVHLDDETYLTDPGRGLYTRQYFGAERYENVFANSYGHGVPRIGGEMQKTGREFCGAMSNVVINAPSKRAEVEFARAYPVAQLAQLTRQIQLSADGVITLRDQFRFDGAALAVEEALMTWCDVEANGTTAIVRGKRRALCLTIEEPQGARFVVEPLEQASRANMKADILKRISVALPATVQGVWRVRMHVMD